MCVHHIQSFLIGGLIGVSWVWEKGGKQNAAACMYRQGGCTCGGHQHWSHKANGGRPDAFQ
eukprot:scaffold304055_cov21-Tisochrysis_lutea.AAC.1